jgi:hypothetical protein
MSARAPFVAITTPNIEQANRLLSVRAHPGFADIIRLSQELVQEAADTCADYPGWDTEQMVVLKVRMQAAKEMHKMLLAKINQAIERGVAEQREAMSTMPAKTATETLEQGDLVRQEVLQEFAKRDQEAESRVPGSY